LKPESALAWRNKSGPQIPDNVQATVLLNSEKLGNLLHRRVTYQGVECRIIEILDEGPALVLQDCRHESVIQANQYGEASRRVPRLFTVSLLNVRRDALNPALTELSDLL
jgi:hypothetical protein